MTDDIVRAVVLELEPRFARIEARLDQCATKDDRRGFATQDRLDRVEEKFERKFDLMLEKMERLRVEMADGFGVMRAETAGVRADLMKWMQAKPAAARAP